MAKPGTPSETHSVSSKNAEKQRLAPAKSTKRRNKPQRRLAELFLNNQIEIASTFIATVIAIHLLHRPSRSFTRKFLALSYYQPETNTYRQGTDDIYFVIAWIVNFTALRAISIEWFLKPFAKVLNVPRKNHLRFAEQGWQVMYYAVFWGLGMYIWYNSSYWFVNTDELWTGWPSRDMQGIFKWYLLAQLAFWLHMIVAVNVEERRHDYAQMLTHHIATCILLTVAYVYRYTRVANVILSLMDPVDLLLPFAKILKYLGYQMLCDACFGIFVITWLFTRHMVYPYVCYRIFRDVPGPNTMLYGCYSGATNEKLPVPEWPDLGAHLLEPFRNLDGQICLNPEVKWFFLGFLLFLQLLSLMWFTMVISVVIKVLRGESADDVRSDDEGEIEGEVEDEELLDGLPEKSSDLEGASGLLRRADITDINVCVSTSTTPQIPSSSSKSRRRSKGESSRFRFADPAERKELLQRIGCVKQPE